MWTKRIFILIFPVVSAVQLLIAQQPEWDIQGHGR